MPGGRPAAVSCAASSPASSSGPPPQRHCRIDAGAIEVPCDPDCGRAEREQQWRRSLVEEAQQLRRGGTLLAAVVERKAGDQGLRRDSRAACRPEAGRTAPGRAWRVLPLEERVGGWRQPQARAKVANRLDPGRVTRRPNELKAPAIAGWRATQRAQPRRLRRARRIEPGQERQRLDDARHPSYAGDLGDDRRRQRQLVRDEQVGAAVGADRRQQVLVTRARARARARSRTGTSGLPARRAPGESARVPHPRRQECPDRRDGTRHRLAPRARATPDSVATDGAWPRRFSSTASARYGCRSPSDPQVERTMRAAVTAPIVASYGLRLAVYREPTCPHRHAQHALRHPTRYFSVAVPSAATGTANCTAHAAVFVHS